MIQNIHSAVSNYGLLVVWFGLVWFGLAMVLLFGLGYIVVSFS